MNCTCLLLLSSLQNVSEFVGYLSTFYRDYLKRQHSLDFIIGKLSLFIQQRKTMIFAFLKKEKFFFFFFFGKSDEASPYFLFYIVLLYKFSLITCF